MFAADSTELCSSDECAVKLRECIIGLGVGICDGNEFCLVSTRPIVNQFVECGIGNDWTKDRQEIINIVLDYPRFLTPKIDRIQ